MSRHTTFRYCLDPTVEQRTLLSRHAGAARFAFNQSLRSVKCALNSRRTDPDVEVPWSGFDLINSFNVWKKSEDAGRIFSVDAMGAAEVVATGLIWRSQVCQQVFEEAAVDCSRALAAWSDSRRCIRRGRRVGFPRFKKKAGTQSFRLRNRFSTSGRSSIRVGEHGARSVILPGIGPIRVHDNTRRLRRLISKDRGRILFATVSNQAGRWWICLNVEAADLHPAQRHAARGPGDHDGWVGVDRGLSVFIVAATADGCEVARIEDPPRPLANGMHRQRRLSKSLSRKQKGSQNRKKAAARLSRHHHRISNVRRHFLHQVTGELVKTHDRLVLEDLNISGMLRNRHFARAINDAGWAEFARVITYKQTWRGGLTEIADRWYPSSKRCSVCGALNKELKLSDRVFTCPSGHRLDRDLNAAVNLAAWGRSRSREPEARAPVTNAHRREGAGRHPLCVDETSPKDVGTDGSVATPAA